MRAHQCAFRRYIFVLLLPHLPATKKLIFQAFHNLMFEHQPEKSLYPALFTFQKHWCPYREPTSFSSVYSPDTNSHLLQCKETFLVSILKTCACPSLGLKYVTWVDIFRLAKKTMFKVAFHGGFNNVWNGVMTIPEVCPTYPTITFFSI